MRNIKLLDFAFAAGTALSLILAGFSEFSEQAERVQGEVLRLHIPANSDSERDQQLKLMLRDELLTEYGKRLSDSGSLSAAEQRAEQLLLAGAQILGVAHHGNGSGDSLVAGAGEDNHGHFASAHSRITSCGSPGLGFGFDVIGIVFQEHRADVGTPVIPRNNINYSTLRIGVTCDSI